MSTDGGIKLGIAAARSLLRRLEQGQIRWLSQLANPAPTVVDSAQASGVELIKALSRFDPMDGWADRLSQPESTSRDEPLGIGARPRSVLSARERSLTNTEGTAPSPRKWRAPDPVETDHKRRGATTNPPRRDKAANLGPDYGETAPSDAGKVPDVPKRDAGRKASRKNHIPADRSLKPASRSEPRPASSAKPFTKAQQVAAVRRALTRNKRLVEAGNRPKPDRIARPDQSGASEEVPAPAGTETGKPAVPELESIIHETLRNAHFPEEPQRTNPTRRTGDTERAGRLDVPASVTHAEADKHAIRSQIRGDQGPARAEPAPPRQAAATPSKPPRVHDDLAQQLADAARIHGVDLA